MLVSMTLTTVLLRARSQMFLVSSMGSGSTPSTPMHTTPVRRPPMAPTPPSMAAVLQHGLKQQLEKNCRKPRKKLTRPHSDGPQQQQASAAGPPPPPNLVCFCTIFLWWWWWWLVTMASSLRLSSSRTESAPDAASLWPADIVANRAVATGSVS